ncbi:GPW/gp25 family protein [Chitiniphilus purpureus]|uniref:GPW/gp25 family protein n=1 Tax=Chitiniphilus purpureus TaxID=2981137 RepID=A0ABY6DW10_9NEIS|nr:GPW/gp25 family protein [Chitiniphilus sp. CD1]UXY17241.1 GPW/gp25 family protein [Chitiniphilus sp. CD1]
MRFLFERLAGEPPLPGGGHEPFDAAAAVGAQIQRLVATRAWVAGERAGLLAFGMPQVTDLAMHSRTQMECYAARLTTLIREYEPRLIDALVSVEPTDNDAWNPWRLVVSGTLADSGQAHRFHFQLPQH